MCVLSVGKWELVNAKKRLKKNLFAFFFSTYLSKSRCMFFHLVSFFHFNYFCFSSVLAHSTSACSSNLEWIRWRETGSQLLLLSFHLVSAPVNAYLYDCLNIMHISLSRASFLSLFLLDFLPSLLPSFLTKNFFLFSSFCLMHAWYFDL